MGAWLHSPAYWGVIVLAERAHFFVLNLFLEDLSRPKFARWVAT